MSDATDATEMQVREVRDNFADIINRVMFSKERVILTRHGKQVCMIVPLDRIPTVYPPTMPQIRLVARPQKAEA